MRPSLQSRESIAEMFKLHPLYMSVIAAACSAQSVGSSWIMQRASIHKYLNPAALAILMLSFRVRGKAFSGIALQ